jgi:dTDP-4-dehydrorhamnose reductase
MTPLQLWGGVECTVNRVGDRYHDQLARSGHDIRHDDVDRFAACGFTALRFPVLWERVAPDPRSAYDWSWSDPRLERMRALRLRPIVGLVHHGSGPASTSLVDPEFPRKLAEYAGAVAARYPWVDEWTPVNEPLTTARFSALYGHWYPHASDDRSFVRALLNQLHGTILAMRAIRAINPDARLVQTDDCGQTFGTPHLAEQIEFEGHRRWLTWDLLTGRVDRHHPLYDYLLGHGATVSDLALFTGEPCPPSIVGLNYYLTSDRWLDDRLARYPDWSHGGNGRTRYADVEAVRARPDGITGHDSHLLAASERYGLPVAITEVHLGCTREEQMRWFVDAWRGAERARAQGADVEAVTAWALLGSHDWTSLVTEERGHYEPGLFDIRSSPPRATALVSIATTLAAGAVPSHPVLRVPGWWHRSERLAFIPTPPQPLESSGAAPLLILGARGTLGQAFHRICHTRGLPTFMASRPDVDMSDPATVDAVLRSVEPWAVINAAGYVRVDDAEQDRDACWRDNVTGPTTLAAACRRRGLPLVTFSSDLVFDGSMSRPYVETDPVSPLNVYGEAKAEAERRVLDLLPEALVIRTSAFFGPWDDYNFATLAIRSVAAGHSWRAAADYVVSPTYVPDLVNAVLDLLIDGEHGIWHLTNPGSMTWLEFARAVTAGVYLDPTLIAPCTTREAWQPASRPPYSVLGSARGVLLRPLDHAITTYCGEMALRLAEETRCASS